MANQLPVRIGFTGFPATFAPANLDTVFKAGVARMTLETESGYVLITEGSALPAINVGPVILNGADGVSRLYLWNNSLGRYTPSVPRAAGFRARANGTINFASDNTWKQVDNVKNDDININSIYDPVDCQSAISSDDTGYWQFSAQVAISWVAGTTTNGTFNLRLRRIYGDSATETIAEGPVVRLTSIGSGSTAVLTLNSPLVYATLNDNFDLQVRGNNAGNTWQVSSDGNTTWFSGWRVSS